METNENYLNLMFNNISYLLKQDLTKYNLHPVEEYYFKEIIKFFENITQDFDSLLENRKFKSNNLNSLYAIPDLINTYDNSKEYFSSLFNKKKPTNEIKELFDLIYTLLKQYFSSRKMNKKIKDVLSLYFSNIAEHHRTQYQFESDDSQNYNLEIIKRNLVFA